MVFLQISETHQTPVPGRILAFQPRELRNCYEITHIPEQLKYHPKMQAPPNYVYLADIDPEINRNEELPEGGDYGEDSSEVNPPNMDGSNLEPNAAPAPEFDYQQQVQLHDDQDKVGLPDGQQQVQIHDDREQVGIPDGQEEVQIQDDLVYDENLNKPDEAPSGAYSHGCVSDSLFDTE